MTDDERMAVILVVSADPLACDMIVGSGGCRKVRVADRGHGKSGCYRVVSYFGGGDVPVYLLNALSKGAAANFSDAAIRAMKATAQRLKGIAP